uniref:Uncharacterized protein n=1 Tax=Parascaris equorum TaxID=6256 RepID=A0A914RPL1_PAREQ
MRLRPEEEPERTPDKLEPPITPPNKRRRSAHVIQITEHSPLSMCLQRSFAELQPPYPATKNRLKKQV